MIMKKILIPLFILLLSSASFALVTDFGLDPLDQTGTAGPLGEGNAYYASGGDMNSLFYNPAGFADAKGMILSVKDSQNFTLGLGYGTPVGSVGFGMIYKKSEQLDFGGVQSKYANSIGVAAYGAKFGRISVGLALKTLLNQTLSRQGFGDVSLSGGLDADVGLMYQPWDYATIGLAVRNAGSSSFTIASSDETFPRSSRIGLRVSLLGEDSIFYNDTYGIVLMDDSENVNIEDKTLTNSYSGIEMSYQGWLFLRAGSGSMYALGTAEGSDAVSSFGLGVKMGDFRIDLASYTDRITDSNVGELSISYTSPGFKLFEEAAQPTQEVQQKDLLVVSAPQDDITTYDETVTVAGEVRHGAKVTINGTEAFVDDSDRFSAVQSLAAGKNLIEIQSSLGGEAKMVQRKVLKKAKVVVAEEVDLNKKIADEVTNKEKELSDREADLKQKSLKGIDVSAQEKQLATEKDELDVKKATLLDEKKKLDERKDKVENLVTLGVIEVSPKKSFEIEAPIKRGEMITWLIRSAGIPTMTGAKTPFVDVPEGSEYAAYISAAADKGLITVPADKKFRPDDPVTEDEAQAFFKAFGVIQ